MAESETFEDFKQSNTAHGGEVFPDTNPHSDEEQESFATAAKRHGHHPDHEFSKEG